MENKYCLILIENNNNKLIKSYLNIKAKDVYRILNKTNFKKLNCKFCVYKAIDSIEIIKDTIEFI